MAKNKSTHERWEGGNPNGNFLKITYEMVDSLAWQSLSRSARSLYVEMKRKYTAKKSNGVLISDNSRDISIPSTSILSTKDERKLYSDLRVFRKDIDELINAGFIDCVGSGYLTREVNIYGFSDRWLKFDKPDFEIPYDVKRYAPVKTQKKRPP